MGQSILGTIHSWYAFDSSLLARIQTKWLFCAADIWVMVSLGIHVWTYRSVVLDGSIIGGLVLGINFLFLCLCCCVLWDCFGVTPFGRSVMEGILYTMNSGFGSHNSLFSCL